MCQYSNSDTQQVLTASALLFSTISLYYIYLPTFGRWIYLLSALCIVATMSFIVFLYWFVDILPTLVSKFHAVAESYLKQYLSEPKQQETSSLAHATTEN
jgi:hypothetical protein